MAGPGFMGGSVSGYQFIIVITLSFVVIITYFSSNAHLTIGQLN